MTATQKSNTQAITPTLDPKYSNTPCDTINAANFNMITDLSSYCHVYTGVSNNINDGRIPLRRSNVWTYQVPNWQMGAHYRKCCYTFYFILKAEKQAHTQG